MLFQFVKSISQFFFKFFQHRLTQPFRTKRSMGMKYSTLSPFVKSNSKNFSIFFQEHRPGRFPASRAQWECNLPHFPHLSNRIRKKIRIFPGSNGKTRSFRLRFIPNTSPANDGSPAWIRARKPDIQPRSARSAPADGPAAGLSCCRKRLTGSL